MNPQPQTIIHHSAVIGIVQTVDNEPPTVSKHHDVDDLLIGKSARSINSAHLADTSWIAQDMTPELFYSVNLVFVNTQRFVVFPKEKVSGVDTVRKG